MTEPTTATALSSREDLGALLAEAAGRVHDLLAAEHPVPASRSYLLPVIGILAHTPQVVGKLNEQLERLADAPGPTTPAGLFALASYAAGLGWLSESLTDLTAAVERICDQADTAASAEAGTEEPAPQWDGVPELPVLQAAAEAANLPLDAYVQALSESLLAAERIDEACTEIAESLANDAALVLTAADVRLDEDPAGLPTLVRTLLARMQVTP